MSKVTEVATISEQRCFEGLQGFYHHESEACGGTMRFAVFLPRQARGGNRVPVLTYLAGLTCTEETFVIKAGAQRIAAALGVMLVVPDTSPRGAGVPGEDDEWDLGTGAGFYVDATQEPWSRHYKMESYVTRDLQAALKARFPGADLTRQGIFGHSMGGHGALTLHLRHPEIYHSVSAFAPIAAPMRCPWGEKAFSAYIGSDREAWKAHDATELVRRQPSDAKLFIDQGSEDQFLAEQLKPELLVEACEDSGQHFELRMQPGYDHSYYFIQSFVEDHLRHHAKVLRA